MKKLGSLVGGLVLACTLSAGAGEPEGAFQRTYEQSVTRMSQPDATFAAVPLVAGPVMPLQPVVDSKTCSQRCSTRCSAGCTTTRGCSSQCKVQTDGCGGGSTSSPSPSPTTTKDPEVIDINTATLEQLLALPGVTSATAKRIAVGRPYEHKAELVTKKVVTQEEYDKIKAWIIAK